jgi:hypothetical protein
MRGIVKSKVLTKVMGESYQLLKVHIAKHGRYATSIKDILLRTAKVCFCSCVLRKYSKECTILRQAQRHRIQCVL